NQRYITVKPDDKLQIIVASKDPQLASIFNLPVVTTRIGQNAAVYSGTSATGYPSTTEGLGVYTVSPEGNIDFPVLGSIHVEGMSRSEVAGFIKGELMGRNLIKDPTVTVEFVNSGVSVLGEVKTPGRYTFNRDQITILDAIAIAGDLDIQGNRENVRVLRKEGNETKVYVVDLTSGKDLYKSPAFYLNQDDIIYVEPNDFRKRQTTVNANTTMSAGFWVSIVSVLTSVAVLVANLVKK
ncbi:MAG: polysaccharide biosynthesis/export family protein, partial [Muribaculaceae bacterium]|nr:polysaccharide biosynthesis/export family protein [Muribaculaceae bacterium]